MRKTNRNYVALEELTTFAAGYEGETENMSLEEVSAQLSANGFDVAALAKQARHRLKRIQNEAAALQAETRLGKVAFEKRSVQEMWTALTARGVPVAARADGSVADEDIEVIYRLTFGEDEDR